MTRADEERREDLAATAASLEADAERLLEIERGKQSVEATDPKLDAMSIEAEHLAEQIEEKSRVERALAHELEPGDDAPRRSN
jgi:hypothetical protein